MRFVNRIPVLAWFLLIAALCYGAWNPTSYSLWYMWSQSAVPLSACVFVGVLFVVIITMIVVETWRTLGIVGLFLYVAFVGAALWVLYDIGLLTRESLASAQWWAQGVVALMLTIGFQGRRMYRAMTGIVPVASVQSDVPHHHG